MTFVPWTRVARERMLGERLEEGRSMILDQQLRPTLTVRGSVTGLERDYAVAKFEHVVRGASRPVQFAEIRLTREADPARERPAIAEASFAVDGRPVRAHVAATTMYEAADLLETRLRWRFEQLADHDRSVTRRRPTDAWRHGDEHRPDRCDRPVEEREVVRRKMFALAPMTPEEAASELDVLDHDFFLFVDARSGEDTVIRHVEGDGYELLSRSEPEEPLDPRGAPIARANFRPARLALDSAILLLDLGDEPSVFFIDAETGRGNVLYRRYDGHYGLVSPGPG